MSTLKEFEKSSGDSTASLNLMGSLSEPENSPDGPLYPDVFPVNPMERYPDLELSGNIISATFRIPYAIGYRADPDRTWELVKRDGHPGLTSSLHHLASAATPWKHTLVAWTGEIREAEDVDFINLSRARHPQQDPDLPDTSEQINPAHSLPVKDMSTSDADAAAVYFEVAHEDRNKLEQALLETSYGAILPVWLGKEGETGELLFNKEEQVLYEQFAEQELYKFLHGWIYPTYDGNGAVKETREEKEAWDHYVKINKAISARILEVYTPGDIIYIHDYHLMLLPAMLKEHIPHSFIGFHLHAPYPTNVRPLRKLPELLKGTLGADIVGLQNSGFSDAFIKACRQNLDVKVGSSHVIFNNTKTPIKAYQIGIDMWGIHQIAFNNAITEQKVEELRSKFEPYRIIVSCEQHDSLRAIGLKLDVFESLLEQHIEWRKKVIFVLMTCSTKFRQDEEDCEVSESQRKIEDRIATINGKYGFETSTGSFFKPIIYYDKALNFSHYLATLRVANIGLLCEGSNHAGHDFVICQEYSHEPLVMLTTAGSANNFPAICIDLQAHEVNAQQLAAALSMSQCEKSDLYQPLHRLVTTHLVSRWPNEMILQLLEHVNKRDGEPVSRALSSQAVQQQYEKSKKRLFLFDYDGTLAPIVEDPHLAIPSDHLLRVLRILAADPQNQVWIISGRDQKFLESWFGSVKGLGLSAEHGSFSRKPDTGVWEGVPARELTTLQELCMPIFGKYTQSAPGSWIETKKITTTWHYRNTDPAIGEIQASKLIKELERTLANWNVVVMAGKANVELRPRGIDKGVMVTKILKDYIYRTIATPVIPDFVLCLGDDKTDEDMFKSLKSSEIKKDDVFTSLVGAAGKRTHAQYYVPNPAVVIKLLNSLVF